MCVEECGGIGDCKHPRSEGQTWMQRRFVLDLAWRESIRHQAGANGVSWFSLDVDDNVGVHARHRVERMCSCVQCKL